MPELPEIAVHAERLSASHTGATLAAFEPLSFTALKTVDPAPDAAVGHVLQGVSHRGKHLLLSFDDLTYVVHLMQGGRLRADTGRAKRPRGGVARWRFTTSHPSLILTEGGTERRAGVWVVRGDPHTQPPLGELGPDADALDVAALAQRLAANPARLHTVLRNQAVLAGIGRRLANEVCHRARLSPFVRTTALDPDVVGRIAGAIRACVAEDIEHERRLSEMSRAKDRPAAVHGRTGEPCPVCGDAVQAVEYRDYTVHYCPGCQTDGRILADNTTSKFLR